MTTPSWLPVAISGTGTILALVAFTYQVHRARFNQSVDLLFRLEADFFSSATKRVQRAKAARDLAAGKLDQAEPILDFFETMALLLKRGALDEEMVWHTFFYWIDNYFTAAETYIRARQAHDPLVWKDLDDLVQQVRALQRQRLNLNVLPPLTPDELAHFLAEEQAEATLEPQPAAPQTPQA